MMKTQAQATAPLAELLNGLSRPQLEEFADAVDYLTSLSQTGHVPERGGIGEIMNRLSPAVRERFDLLSQVMETPRVQPFAPKLSEADHANAMGFDPDLSQTVKAAMDGQYVAGKLQQRMGTDAQRKPDPISRRDQVAAAWEKHDG
jgi:hypothetical protein